MDKILRHFFIILCGLLLAGCPPFGSLSSIKELKGEVFGSYYLIKYRGELEEQELAKKLESFFSSFNKEFSTYLDDSVISIYNRAGKNERIKVSPRFITMLELSKKFHQETNGAFEPTLGPVIKAWGFGGGKKKASDQVILSAMKKVGLHHVKWDQQSLEVWKDLDGVELDVNAFAPGWAADLVGEILLEHKIRNFMVDISGEILFKGTKDEDKPWIAGIEKPSKEYAKGVALAFKILDAAIATSGDYRQFFNDNGLRRSHIIDPRTGRPVTHNISSASVISDTAASADAWGTAMMVLGIDGLSISEKHGKKVFLLKAEKPDGFNEVVSDSMKSFIEAHRL